MCFIYIWRNEIISKKISGDTKDEISYCAFNLIIFAVSLNFYCKCLNIIFIIIFKFMLVIVTEIENYHLLIFKHQSHATLYVLCV